jgi:SNF2 family DNA or RNA helicase
MGELPFRGKSILVDASFIRSINELVDHVTPISATPKKSVAQRRFLLIYTNEDEVNYAERDDGKGRETRLILPRALKDQTLLKTHQRAGLAWLQHNFLLKRRGCLLADDMGLGKTLQVLAFLAWLIEEGQLSPDGGDSQVAPWDPILIVAPVILLENETWLNDMRTFFAGEGAIFQPWLTLHGSNLRSMRRSDAVGQEIILGQPMLDLERLRQNRVILTNYETVTNYQHSFARMKDHWTVVVTDEAQEYKTPNTKISHALKSLAPRFRIACTGTPVETRLLDLWNIFDFLQPGPLLGSATEFGRTYDPANEGKASESTAGALVQLKNRLRYGQTDAFIIRREKTSLAALPTKHEHQLMCNLSPEQRQWHLGLIGRAHTGGEGNHPLRILQDLMRLYQHPTLFPRYEPVADDEEIKRCPKLAVVLECLDGIRAKGEKALIFTRSLDMQQLLARVFSAVFGFNVDIINGATRRHGSTQISTQTRRAIISRFRERAGFDVLVLSPDVAGIGLTLVEANHVIHYGRWWNPARESQATDRVYRIGQERDVHIYYPMAVDPEKVFETFDEKLHKLICRRRDMAAEFLAPTLTEDDLGQELLQDMLVPL